MHLVTVRAAKTHLSALIREALEGEEVAIAKGRTPVVRIQPVQLARTVTVRRVGGLKGLVKYISADFDEPLADFSEAMLGADNPRQPRRR
jgi:antitoxin (DNA-binding transcriptional repressor) of toxin-antitoxin stability system